MTPPLYWEDQHYGLWLADNPLPGQTMDALLQIEFRFPRRGLPDMMLRIERAKLLDALGKAQAFWASRQPGVSAVHRCGMFIALGDFDYRYFITVSTEGGIYHAESKEDAKGVKITLERTRTESAPETKRKFDATKSYEMRITGSDFARLCAKFIA